MFETITIFITENTEALIAVGAIILLILISALFSGSETALTAASRARIKQMRKQKSQRAETVSKLLETPEKLIGAILLGNNLVNILASAIATSFFIKFFGAAGVAYATLTMTFVILIFAEVLPKTYALQQPEKLALFVAPIMRTIVFVLTPLVVIIRAIVNFFLWIFGVRPPKEMDKNAADAEIRGNIDLQHEEGVMVKNDRDMLGGILDLKQMGVEDVMIHRTNIFSLDIALGATEIATQILNNSYTRVPLYRNEPDNFIGILHTKDLLWAINAKKQAPKNSQEKDLESLLTPIWYVPETTSLQDQLNNFLKRKSHFALVVDEYGETQGLITLEDILEEIVGDIIDEHDHGLIGMRRQPNGSVNVDGHVSVRDLNRAMDWQLPQDDAISLAGLIINEAQIIPNVGQAFNFYGFRFEILRKQANRLTAIRVTKL
ncbi:MAG: HlyC/CorC family transporter [Alphaproteobacteria bacterium]|nr:HlyC/CorC family transporter [Alphaproteobacteria bacterium]